MRAALIIAAAAAAAAGCAGPKVARSPDVQSAECRVQFEPLDDSRTSVELEVKNLEEPERLAPPAYTYVVWARRGPEDAPRNLGALAFDEDLNGELRAVVDLPSFELFVTAEAAADVEKPTRAPLLWTNYDRAAWYLSGGRSS